GNFAGASFHKAELTGADLKGADLSGARGLTQDQIEDACTDGSTRLPGGLRGGGCRRTQPAAVPAPPLPPLPPIPPSAMA
ncbi:pentapeptide repeat-containing protein, partial [Acinetobacter baumannii]